ncbi:MAG: cytochrome c biogenesis protein CcsA [Gammaproteobacteria bacterium]|jgi:ABC-type uncharacterized transport system permease subunit
MNATFSGLLAIALYLAASTWLAVRIARRSGHAGRFGAIALGMLAVAFHTTALYPAVFTPAGMDLGLSNSFSLVGWQVALIILLISLRRPVENLATVVLPVVALSVLIMLAFPHEKIIVSPSGWQLDAHILLSILAYSLLSVAAVQALVLAFQDRQLRLRRTGGLLRALPPLEIMEDLLFQLIGAGFALLSLALFSGLIFVHNLFAQHLVQKTVLSIFAWVLFGVLLWGRWRFGWRGRTAIRWTLGGFVALMLAFFGTKILLEVVFNTHWS